MANPTPGGWPPEYDLNQAGNPGTNSSPSPAPAASPAAPAPPAAAGDSSTGQSKASSPSSDGGKAILCGEPPWLAVARAELAKGVCRKGFKQDELDAQIKASNDGQNISAAKLKALEDQVPDNSDILKYLQATNVGTDGNEFTPWCGAFVAWVLKNTPPNSPNLKEKPSASYAKGIPDLSALSASWTNYGEATSFPIAYGAIVTFHFPGEKQDIDHVSFAVGRATRKIVDKKGKETDEEWLICLGGNQWDHQNRPHPKKRYFCVREGAYKLSWVRSIRFPSAWPKSCWQELPVRAGFILGQKESSATTH